MDAHSTAPQPYYPPRRWPWMVGGLVVAAVAGFLIWFFLFRDTGSDVVHGPSGAPFTVTLPSGWRALSETELAQQPGTPLAVFQQTDGAGVVIVNTQPPTNASLTALAKEVEKKLKQTIPDYKFINSATINIPAGQAASISYARPKQGTANTLVVVPAGGRIYTLNSIIPGGQRNAAAQAADIIKSFNA